jgi:tripartite-type tricarboxylate transporter receptor subunit TctC
MKALFSASFKRVVLAFAIGFCALLLSQASPAAQGDVPAPDGYPRKDINVIIPFPAGGGTDITGRGFLKVAEKYIKARFLVTNVGGAGGWAGWQQSLAQPHDGYNLALLTVNMFTDSGTNKTYKDFTPIGTVSRYPTVIAVAASSDILTLDDLIKKAKDNPGDLRFGMDGINGTDHLSAQKFEKLAGLKFKYVPYRGGGETIAAALGGNVDALTCNSPEAGPRSDMRILAVMDDQRLGSLPDVPTMKELGYDVVLTRFRTMGIQADAPAPVIGYLESVFAKAAADPEWLKWADSVHAEPYYMNRADSIQYLEEMYAAVAASLGLAK